MIYIYIYIYTHIFTYTYISITMLGNGSYRSGAFAHVLGRHLAVDWPVHWLEQAFSTDLGAPIGLSTGSNRRFPPTLAPEVAP